MVTSFLLSNEWQWSFFPESTELFVKPISLDNSNES